MDAKEYGSRIEELTNSFIGEKTSGDDIARRAGEALAEIIILASVVAGTSLRYITFRDATLEEQAELRDNLGRKLTETLKDVVGNAADKVRDRVQQI